MSVRNPLPGDLAGVPFSVPAARSAGVPRSRMRAGDLETPFRGVRRAVAPEQPETRDAAELARRSYDALVLDCISFLARERQPVVISHVTAARLYGMPLPRRLENRRFLDVAAIVPAHAPQGAGVIGHRLEAGSVSIRLLRGIPVPSPVDTWLQLGPLLGVDELILVGDFLVRRKRPFATLDELQDVVSGLRGKRGVRLLRAAMPDIRSGTDSPAETRTRLIIVRAGLPEPVIGYTVYDRNGFFVGTPDLAFVAERVALDYEGDIHRVDQATFREDIERREMFQDAGWRHIRVTGDHLARPGHLIDRVSSALALAQRRPTR